ncbi:hypothetical protein OSB04_002145 [Centaurea solstitialis]|uniref:Uncharacterized protein n=1 Tax=Centaurea solstitialis TaxID=347529 RepID=A0AA38WUQ9_9ASTR|nr:hypothetical protein OSB04_002145 [Centaurea solstitialis]
MDDLSDEFQEAAWLRELIFVRVSTSLRRRRKTSIKHETNACSCEEVVVSIFEVGGSLDQLAAFEFAAKFCEALISDASRGRQVVDGALRHITFWTRLRCNAERPDISVHLGTTKMVRCGRDLGGYAPGSCSGFRR